MSVLQKGSLIRNPHILYSFGGSRRYTQNSNLNLVDKLTEVQNRRLTHLKEESSRLKSDPLIKNRITSFKDFFGSVPNEALVPYGRAIEVLNKIKATHYVFTHGASRRQLCLNVLSVELFFQKQNNQFLKFQTLLRHPSLFSENNSLEWYKNNITGRDKMTDDHYRKFLISADYILENSSLEDSAVSRLLMPKKLVYSAYLQAEEKIIDEAFCSKEARVAFVKKFTKIKSKVYDDDDARDSFGDYYAICVQKSDFPLCGYIAKPYGEFVKVKDEKKELEKGQDNFSFFAPATSIIPFQVRLLAQKLIPPTNDSVKLKPENVTLVFPSIPDQKYFELVLEIRSLIAEYAPWLKSFDQSGKGSS